MIAQQGHFNTAHSVQSGFANMSVTMQHGNGNAASIEESGKGNAAAIVQIGNGFAKAIEQSGNYQSFSSYQMSTRAKRAVSGSRTLGLGLTSVTVEFSTN